MTTAPPAPFPEPPRARPLTVAMVTLGCARNEVDSEELAGRLESGGFELVADPAAAETVMVNTCGFIDAAKKDSVDTLLQTTDLKGAGGARAVVAVGCMAERYGAELASALPEADAVLSFDDYPDIAARLRGILAGDVQHPHTPSDRRLRLPIAPAERAHGRGVAVPGHGDRPATGAHVAEADDLAGLPPGVRPASGPRVVRRRLGGGPMAPLKLASGCDRRCTFCAIPAFRGSFVSRPPEEVLAEAQWLAGQQVRELFLVSENSTSYGKDLGDLGALEALLPRLAAVARIERVRVSYLQPAETRPGLVRAIAETPGVADYYDLSFQHAAPAVLRRMRRFGDPDSFLSLLDSIRAEAPRAGVRSNVIVGFPGETEQDLDVLCDFLVAARLDVVGVFGYSDEDGTAAASYDGKLDEPEVRARIDQVSRLVEELTAQRAEDRIGETVEVLVESLAAGSAATGGSVRDGSATGRAAHQGPEVDGVTTLSNLPTATRIGDVVSAVVEASDGVDLVARATTTRTTLPAPRPGIAAVTA